MLALLISEYSLKSLNIHLKLALSTQKIIVQSEILSNDQKTLFEWYCEFKKIELHYYIFLFFSRYL